MYSVFLTVRLHLVGDQDVASVQVESDDVCADDASDDGSSMDSLEHALKKTEAVNSPVKTKFLNLICFVSNKIYAVTIAVIIL